MRKERILLLALPGIGDALLCTPMIELLRKAKPHAEIHALVMFAATREMFEHDPFIDVVHFHDFIKSTKPEAMKFVASLRKLDFDTSISIYPQNRREYNIIATLIGAKDRLGVRYRRRDPQNLNWLNTRTIVEDDTLHCVEENVRILTLLGIDVPLDERSLPDLRLTITLDHAEFAEAWYTRQGLLERHPLIGFHAGTALFKNHVKRRWAPEKFAELAVRLTKELGAKVLLFGGPDDIEANDIITRLAGECVVPVATKSILDSVAVMERLDMFVSNDSSLMHIAGALKLPTVAIFGPTNETYVHPWRTNYRIVHTGIECRPCFVYSPKPLTCYRTDPAEHFLCVRGIEVDQVFSAVDGLIGNPLTVMH